MNYEIDKKQKLFKKNFPQFNQFNILRMRKIFIKCVYDVDCLTQFFSDQFTIIVLT